MKKQKIQKIKLTWNSLEFNNPYGVIKEIFEFAHIGFYRKFIRDVLLYTTKNKQYKKHHAGNIMFLLEGIKCLLNACFLISKEKMHSLLEVREEDIMNGNFYSLYKTETGLWADFPRSLTKPEIIDPYKAFAKIFQHNSPNKWYEIIKYLAEDACGSYSDMLEENPLEVYIQVTKLFEAAHLINVREIAHVTNWRQYKNQKD